MKSIKFDDMPDIMNRVELAEVLGVRPRTIEDWLRNGRAPTVSYLAGGRLTFWRKADVIDWLDGNR